jgi:hypothetical protein
LEDVFNSVEMAVKLGTPRDEVVIALNAEEWEEFTTALLEAIGTSPEETEFASIEFNGATVMSEAEYFGDDDEDEDEGEELFVNMLNAISNYLDFARKAA